MVLAGGATAWRDLPVPGRELTGIYQAMEYLPPSNRVQEGDLDESPISAQGKHVVIIGGGDTGADCLGTAIRQGAATIHQFEILPRPPDARDESMPWPTYPMMLPRRRRRTKRAASASTRSTPSASSATTTATSRALRAHEVEQRFVDGRMTFEKIEGTDFELPCELVLLAMGFVGPQREGLLEQLGVELNERGNVARDDAASARTSPNVFVAGDMGRGPEPDRVGDRRGPLVRGRGRRVPDGRDAAARADRARRGADALNGMRVSAVAVAAGRARRRSLGGRGAGGSGGAVEAGEGTALAVPAAGRGQRRRVREARRAGGTRACVPTCS